MCASDLGAMLRILPSMWLGSVAQIAAISLGGPLADLNHQLQAESKADAEASDGVKCWCNDVQSALDERLRNSESEISDLERIRDSRFYENVRLNIEVKQHKEEIDDQTQSMAAADAIAGKHAMAHANEKEDTTQALKQLRQALGKVPQGSEVHGALQGLEDTFANNLENARQQHERRDAQFKDVSDAKGEMLKLARKGLRTKLHRVADGKVVIAQAKSEIAAYSAQRDADWSLQASLRRVCDDVANAATNREKQRRDIMIAISQANAKQAENAAMKAMQNVMLLKQSTSVGKTEFGRSKMLQALGFQGDCAGVKEHAEDAKRRADGNLASAKKNARDIIDLMDKSHTIQADLEKMLGDIFMNTHLATMKNKLETDIKSKVSNFGDIAQADKKATPDLFNEVRAKGKKTTQADMKVVTSLQMGAATAGQAVVDANQCI